MSMTEIIQSGDLIVAKGFLGVALVLIFIVGPALYLWNAERAALGTVFFGIGLLATYAVLDIVQKYFPDMLFERRLLSGSILEIKNGFIASLQSDDYRGRIPYTKRENDPQSAELYNLPFMFLATDKPTCLTVAFSSTDPNSEITHVFNIAPITKEDLSAAIELKAQLLSEDAGVSRLRVWREGRDGHKLGDPVELEQLAPGKRSCKSQSPKPTSAWLWPFSIAVAQEVGSYTDWAGRLRNDDPLTRRDARQDLAALGVRAFPIMNQLLDMANDYRLQLGAVVALALMPEDVRKQAPADLLVNIRKLLAYKDKTMRDNALRALDEPAFCYQEEDKNKPSGQRFLTLCQWSMAQCERTRGPNRKKGITQTACAPVKLLDANWNYQAGGTEDAWYAYSGAPFPQPFPQLGTIAPRPDGTAPK